MLADSNLWSGSKIWIAWPPEIHKALIAEGDLIGFNTNKECQFYWKQNDFYFHPTGIFKTVKLYLNGVKLH